MFAQSDVAMKWLVGPIVVLAATVIGTLPARTDVVSYPTNSQAALLIRNGGRVVASTTGAVFIRGVDDRLFECAVVGGDDTLNSMFNQHGIKFSGLQTKLISACSELEPQTREASLFLLGFWVLRGGNGGV
jgi:hypothetical protein